MFDSRTSVLPVVIDTVIPAGMLGPDPVPSDVRCFLVPHNAGVLLVDTGIPGSEQALGAALSDMGACWADVTDVVLSHCHFDHTGGLPKVLAAAPDALVWAGAADISSIDTGGPAVSALRDGDRIRTLTVVATPGHTAGHVSLLDEAAALLLVGDLVGVMHGAVTRAPAAFTVDAVTAEDSLRRIAALELSRVLFSHGAERDDGPTVVKALVDLR